MSVLFVLILCVFSLLVSSCMELDTEDLEGPLWIEDFNGAALNPAIWTVETGNGQNGWGNNEKEYYRGENAEVAGGILTIRAKKETAGSFSYTSARIKTQGKFSVSGGRVEARIKMPRGKGFWPAFWMLGEKGGTWPANGEIDIVEMKGGIADHRVDGTVHFGTSYPASHYYLGGSFDNASPLGDDWHVYGVEWSNNRMRWLFDGEVYHEVDLGTLPAVDSKEAAINQELANIGAVQKGRKFYLLLNLAIGGNYIQNQLPDDSAFASAENTCMQIDWIKVWR
jgi:beta-glucanase (GH16 family)